jgi:predicted Zn-dependent protease
VAGYSTNSVHEPAALPGGYIFVPASLILSTQTEAELAGMLAHSMAHIVARHGTRQATSAAPLIYMGGWQGYGGNDGGTLVPLAFANIMRGHEYDADRLAIRAMAKAGYDPTAMLAYLRRVQPEKPPNLYAIVPPKQERLAAVQKEIQELPFATYRTEDNLPPIQDEVRQAIPRPAKKPPTLRFQRPPRSPRLSEKSGGLLARL